MWAMEEEKYMGDPVIRDIFVFTTYVSGVLYYISTCINAVVYNIMSNKFRQAFKVNL
jgi:neuromedin U receptor 1